MHSKKQDKNTVRHIGIHKNEDLLESETFQIPIDGSFQIFKERKKRGQTPFSLHSFRLKSMPLKMESDPHSVVELTGIEPVTSCLQSRRSPS
jgi:hypothetical protein